MKLSYFMSFISLVTFFSCESRIKQKQHKQKNINLVEEICNKNCQIKDKKISIISNDSIIILGEKYYAFFLSNDQFIILNKKNDTLYSDKELCSQFKFEDFNKDGIKDIRFYYLSNTPSVQDLILFDIKSNSFKKIENFFEYPAPEKIGKTKYYYSYHRSGCADMNWDSDLFYIKNFKTYKIGNISGKQCENRDVKDAIYIHKIIYEKEILFKTLPILETLGQYEDYKWGFIAEYWAKNYRNFIR